MPVNSIFAVFESGNDNPLLQSRINTDFLTITFSTIMEDKDYDK